MDAFFCDPLINYVIITQAYTVSFLRIKMPC